MNNIKKVENYNLQNLTNDFINYLDVKGKSAETYTLALKQFFKWTCLNEIKSPSRDDIIRYREELKLRVKPTTIQGYMIAVKQFFKWTSMMNLYPNICDNVKGIKIDNTHKRDALTSSQAKSILSSITNDRDYALISLMITCGLRTIEIERANISDIKRIEDTNVLFIQGKGKDDKAEFVKIPNIVYNSILKYLNNREDNNEALFVSESNRDQSQRLVTRSIRYIVKKYFRENDLDSERLSAHSLRHTAGTIALLNGSSLEEVQQLLRHKKIDTTMIYVHHLNRLNNNSENYIANAIF